MEKFVTIYHRDGLQERTVDVFEAGSLAGSGQVGNGKDWAFAKPDPLGWEKEIPQYCVSRAVRPAPNARVRSEPPFSECSDADVWQYATQPLAAGQTIETTDWPHPSFRAINFSAGQVLAFFNGALKSRMPRSPWHNGRVRLDSGLSGPVIANVRPPAVQPMNLTPVRAA